MTKSEIFKAAHKMAKTFVGSYVACFALALKSVYKSIKEKVMTPAHQYCVEFYERTVENLKNFHDQPAIELSTIEKICAKDEFMSLAVALNNAKITSIVETMQMSKNPLSKANPNPRSFKKITRAQCQAVARALLAQYDNSAMSVIDAAFAK